MRPTPKFGRVCYIEVANVGSISDYRENGTTNCDWEKIEGLDIKFDIQHPIYALESSAKISILGLSRDRITQLATWGEENSLENRCSFIRVYAGYASPDNKDSVDKIFEGIILRAMPTMPPDVWLEISARSFFMLRAQVFTKDLASVTLEGDRGSVSLKEFLSIMCDAAGDSTPAIMESIPNLDKQVTLPVFDKPATVKDLVDEISKMCKANDISYYTAPQDDGKIHFSFSPTKYAIENIKEEEILQISAETGMIGLPQLDFKGATVTTFLNNTEKDLRLGLIRITSKKVFPGMFARGTSGTIRDKAYWDSEVYKVLEIRYHGHFRGDEWYVTYKAMRNFTIEGGVI